MQIIKIVLIPFAIFFIILIFISGCLQDTSEVNSEDDSTYNNSKTLYVGSTTDVDYHNIQDAINAASNGTTIIVENGTYNETLTINYTINLIGAGINNTIIDCSNIWSNSQITGIHIQADNCNLQGFTLTKSSSTAKVIGIKVNSYHNNISHITISNVSEGLYLERNSNINTICWNTISNNNWGIYIENSFYNNFSNNYISSNREYGIYLESFSYNNMISSNCISFNEYGIRIKSATHNTIIYNSITHNSIGVYCCCGGYFNSIILNTFKNNTEFNAIESGLEYGNYWNTDYPSYEGNYWDDYYGVDENNDGFGDTSYDIPSIGSKDSYPLMKPNENTICISK